MARILIADDHRVLREGVKQILADAFPGACFGEAGSLAEVLEQLPLKNWSAMLLDVFMPGRGGLEVLPLVRRSHPHVPVLVLSSAPEEQLATRVLRAGAAGYLNKQAAPEELVRALQKVIAGGRYISPALAERLAADASRGEVPPIEKLSAREFQVMQQLVEGKTIKEIAGELGLSVKTVSTFHTRIWAKLRVKNDVELVHYAINQGIVPRPV